MAIGNLSKQDILEALGVEAHGGWMGPAAAAFGIGLVVGAAAALLLAPKSGAELRDDIGHRVHRMRERIPSMEDQNNPRTTV
jgi:hypothetical protein